MSQTGKPPLPNRKKGGMPVWGWIVGGILVVLIGFGIFAFVRFNNFKEATFGGRNEASLLPTDTPKPQTVTAVQTTSAIKTIVAPTAIPIPTATPEPLEPIIRNIKSGNKVSLLIMGYGGGNHDGGYLTDTIIQVVFDPQKKAVSMISIPRDLWVFVPYGGKGVGYWGKINSSFAYIMNMQDSSGLSSRYRFQTNNINSQIDASAILAKDVVENVTGVPIDYWAVLSFDGFRQFIDAIGGIYVNVEKTFDDYEYPRNDDPNIDPSFMHIHFDAGRQFMNGEKAIQYSRSRHSLQDGTDFGRSKRQMNVLTSVKEQVSKPDILLKALPIMNALEGKVRTSLNFEQVTALASYFKSGEGATLANNLLFIPLVLSTENFLTSAESTPSAYLLTPFAGQGNYKEIQSWIKSGLLSPQLRYENLSIQLKNATGLNSPLTTATDMLESNGLSVIQPEWATPQNTTEIWDYSQGKAKETLKVLKTVFPRATIKTGEVTKNYSGPAMIVVLGKDFSQQNTVLDSRSK
jgi:LCP family protein required for cell wall assembly